jgi:hypothetical protein
MGNTVFQAGHMGNTFRHLGETHMPWRECCKMDERLRFVARLLEGEKMAELCREFGTSRKTGYEIFTAAGPTGRRTGCLSRWRR